MAWISPWADGMFSRYPRRRLRIARRFITAGVAGWLIMSSSGGARCVSILRAERRGVSAWTKRSHSITQLPGRADLGSAVRGEGIPPLPVNSNSCVKLAKGRICADPAAAVRKKRLWS
ncbi:hypothetical protein PARHAE_01015 [Paracoccus haematequi]|uniref:Uncharacterized protein n=1 Tax=Paracoccus haematequi TaxID=2491866 RepID=A0A447IK08_9RHOB|nr:hypothetical protein PARHAE_01015 [Paracoccus haematequi]